MALFLMHIRRVSSGTSDAEGSKAIVRSIHMVVGCTDGSVVAGATGGAATPGIADTRDDLADAAIVQPPAAV
jgi:hypothetical protein